jgi:hypothetical protein
MQVKKGRGVGILGLRLEMSYETIELFLQFVQLYAHEYQWFPVDLWDAGREHLWHRHKRDTKSAAWHAVSQQAWSTNNGIKGWQRLIYSSFDQSI